MARGHITSRDGEMGLKFFFPMPIEWHWVKSF